ncbi:chromosome condensation complex Condensin, subunit G [Teratosphaeria nubilosa]|uniref:Chromosome condensation complex Condensin, subunit G n=1 Tax=Teratosphaeria nubilosa TaxID=161662 RepID=A0A6G1L717_9PEZI|nr:chromosome condensation complex Condensin, subunit G [Teratosphaeria nubilosa]
MPGRVARGSARSSAASRKSSTQNLKSGRNSSPTVEVPDEGADTTLRRAVCLVFGDAQKSTAGHRKAVISLRKVQEACCYEPINQKKGKQEEDFDEEDFNSEFVRCVLRVLPVRKAEPVGDRVVRFVGTFLSVASQKDNEIASQADPDATSVPETPTSRLTTSVLSTLLPLLSCKDKAIRFRATQITSHLVHSLDTLDDQLFHQLRIALLKRIHDKEAPVRLQAVYGLGRLAAEVEDNENRDDSDSDDDVAAGVLGKLLDILQNDPAAEVRRNLLLNLPLTKEALPYLLERARDADGSTRRALYARLLPALGDFRHLSLTHREKLLRWGMRDRDETVRKATSRLFRERWIEDCAALPADQAAEQQEEGEVKPVNQAAAPSLDALLELLERIDVVNSGVEDGIALIAMREFWEGRPDYVEYVSFPDQFWTDLSPELAFVARTFNDYCRTSGKEDGYDGPRMLDGMLEDKLPEVTKFAFLLERELQKLVEVVQLAADEEDEDAAEDSVQREFVVEQMLHMALTFDYSDDFGRRKMFNLMRVALANPSLPEEATKLVVEVLRLVCGEDVKGEREFCGIVLEAVAEVHDAIMEDATETEDTSNGEDSFHSATELIDDEQQSAKAAKKQKPVQQTAEQAEKEQMKALQELMVNLKCLHIAQCMLQNVQCDLEENVHLVTMLNTLVVPAVRSQEAPIRERGLVCLGLCCLLGKNLAEENLTLFLHCFAKGHPLLQAICLQTITDILITHPSLLSPPAPDPTSIDATTATEPQQPENPLLKQVLKAFSKSLKSSDATVQSTGATALSKAMLSRLITDTDLLKQVVIAYFDPDTAPNAQLRQSLSYFLPMYCHSRAVNAARMVSVTCSILAKLSTLRDAYAEEAEVDSDVEEGGGMVKLSVVGQMLLDWTDPRKIVGFAEAAGTMKQESAAAAEETHFLLCEYILERLVTSQVSKDEKKVLFQMLGKLHLPQNECEGERLVTLLELSTEAIDTGVATDATGRNTLTKLKNLLLKLMHDVATAERGGGGEETTIIDATEVPVRGGSDTGVEVEEEEEEEETTAIDATKTIGGTTIGAPDAEGTRVGLRGDSELLDSDEEMEDC